MKQILSFVSLAINWLSRTSSNLSKNAVPGSKYVLREDALKYLDLALYEWVKLACKYYVIMNLKKRDSLQNVHTTITSKMAELEELKGFDLKKGSPFTFMMHEKALSIAELNERHGPTAATIDLDLLLRLLKIIITYNFFKKFKERSMGNFEPAEADMKSFVEEHRLPGRFSWNAFVPKEAKQDVVADFSFLREYDDSIEMPI